MLSGNAKPSKVTLWSRCDSTHSSSSIARRPASASTMRKCSRRRLPKASPAGSATASCGVSKAKSSASACMLLHVGINSRRRLSNQRSAREERKRSDGQQRELSEAARIARLTAPQARSTRSGSRWAKALATTPTGSLQPPATSGPSEGLARELQARGWAMHRNCLNACTWGRGSNSSKASRYASKPDARSARNAGSVCSKNVDGGNCGARSRSRNCITLSRSWNSSNVLRTTWPGTRSPSGGSTRKS
mmetsp:Transcript_88029/g.272665  ORF Transcript_88029/g.272665 Transcript_88029/m.272665 type:complete len:248 (+) Transcript_88029:976-1719(+)